MISIEGTAQTRRCIDIGTPRAVFKYQFNERIPPTALPSQLYECTYLYAAEQD